MRYDKMKLLINLITEIGLFGQRILRESRRSSTPAEEAIDCEANSLQQMLLLGVLLLRS